MGIEPSPLDRIAIPGSPLVFIKRDDRIHPQWGGNKWRKLKYHLESYRSDSYSGMISFGGIHSNHLFALAALCHEEGIPMKAYIRGHDPLPLTPTLEALNRWRVRVESMNTDEYREQKRIYGFRNGWMIIPEGGSDELALRGVSELADEIVAQLPETTHVLVPVGSGGTIAGLILELPEHIQIFGVVPMKAEGMNDDLTARFARIAGRSNWQLIHNYHYGGFGKFHPEVIRIMQSWVANYQVPLDPVYTAKMALALEDLMKRGIFPEESRVVLIHTGGLQGIKGYLNAYRNQIAMIT